MALILTELFSIAVNDRNSLRKKQLVRCNPVLIITDVVVSETLRNSAQPFLLFPQNVVDFDGKLICVSLCDKYILTAVLWIVSFPGCTVGWSTQQTVTFVTTTAQPCERYQRIIQGEIFHMNRLIYKQKIILQHSSSNCNKTF